MSEPEQPADVWDAVPPGGGWQGGGQAPQMPSGYGYPPPYYYQPYPVRRTNGFSIAALVCGICGFVYLIPAILGIVFGVIAIRQIKRDGTDGRGMAIAGLVTGLCWFALLAFIILMALSQ